MPLPLLSNQVSTDLLNFSLKQIMKMNMKIFLMICQVCKEGSRFHLIDLCASLTNHLWGLPTTNVDMANYYFEVANY